MRKTSFQILFNLSWDGHTISKIFSSISTCFYNRNISYYIQNTLIMFFGIIFLDLKLWQCSLIRSSSTLIVGRSYFQYWPLKYTSSVSRLACNTRMSMACVGRTLLSVYFQTKLLFILFSETIAFRDFFRGSHTTNATKWGIILKTR